MGKGNNTNIDHAAYSIAHYMKQNKVSWFRTRPIIKSRENQKYYKNNEVITIISACVCARVESCDETPTHTHTYMQRQHTHTHTQSTITHHSFVVFMFSFS